MRKNQERVCLIIGWLGILFLSAGCNLEASKKPVQEAPASSHENKLSVHNMQSDLSILWSAIQEIHPGYGIYTPADSLEKKYEDVRSSLREPMSEDEFIFHIYPFLCALGCGHTQIKHSAGYQPPVKETVVHLPFQVLVRGQRAWMTTTKMAKLATGDEKQREG